jgi:uncharacterized protein YeaO (DUF488 family)
MTPRAGSVLLCRVYDHELPVAGRRVLVDRLWPRGIAKAALHLDEWCKDVAPSTELRRWYGHDPERFDEFSRRYIEELDSPPGSGAVERLTAMADADGLVLLTATRDVEHSGAEVLLDHLMGGTLS